MAVTKEKPAPYAPAKTVLDIVTRYRARGLAFPVNAEVLARAGVPESLVQRTLQALVTLGLFNEAGNPTETLEAIRLAPEEELKTHMQNWLKAAYADVFQFVDPTTDDENRVRDAFRPYQPQGQQDRMVSLFLGLCTAAGLSAEKKSATPPRTVIARAVGRTAPPARSRTAPVVHALNAADLVVPAVSSLPPAITGLLQSLPSPDVGWTKDRRDKFVNSFEAILDFYIPVVQDNETTENGGQS